MRLIIVKTFYLFRLAVSQFARNAYLVLSVMSVVCSLERFARLDTTALGEPLLRYPVLEEHSVM